MNYPIATLVILIVLACMIIHDMKGMK